MHSWEAELFHKRLLGEVYAAAKASTAHIRVSEGATLQEEFIRSFATIEGLMKLAAEIIADEIAQAPAVESAILDDVVGALGAFLAEEKIARLAPAFADLH